MDAHHPKYRTNSTTAHADSASSALLDIIAEKQDATRFRTLLWEGTFADYLSLVENNSSSCRLFNETGGLDRVPQLLRAAGWQTRLNLIVS